MSDVVQRRRTVALAIGAVVVIAAVVAAVLVIVPRDESDDPAEAQLGTRTLALPSSVGGYVSAPPDDPERFETSIRTYLRPLTGDTAAGVLRHGVVGTFGRDGAILTVVGVALRDAPGIVDRVEKSGLAATVQDFLRLGLGTLGARGRPQAFPPGPLGGALRCTATAAAGVRSSACAWGDNSTFGLMVYLAEPFSLSEAASRTRTLRPVIERD